MGGGWVCFFARKFIFPVVYKGWSLQAYAPLLYEAERRDVAKF